MSGRFFLDLNIISVVDPSMWMLIQNVASILSFVHYRVRNGAMVFWNAHQGKGPLGDERFDKSCLEVRIRDFMCLL